MVGNFWTTIEDEGWGGMVYVVQDVELYIQAQFYRPGWMFVSHKSTYKKFGFFTVVIWRVVNKNMNTNKNTGMNMYNNMTMILQQIKICVFLLVFRISDLYSCLYFYSLISSKVGLQRKELCLFQFIFSLTTPQAK